jgi:hypothetical protein
LAGAIGGTCECGNIGEDVVDPKLGVKAAAGGIGMVGAEVGLDAAEARFIMARQRVVVLLPTGLSDFWTMITESRK